MAGVPAYITPLSYIRGSGSQYITTEINLRSTDVVKSRWRFENSAGNVYGCFSGSSANDNFCLYAGSASTNAYIRYNGQVVRDFKAANGTIYNLEHGPDGFFANGDQVTSFNAATFECSAPMYIFMLPNSSSAKVTARCYGLTVYRGGEQVCNFIPARNELTGEVGFYESVQGVFYENAGTGAFTAGPEVNFSVKTLLLKRRRALASVANKFERQPGWDGYCWFYYEISDVSSPTQLTYDGRNIPDKKIIVDGVEVAVPNTSSGIRYQFSAPGRHLVKIPFNTIGASVFSWFYNIKTLTEAYLAGDVDNIGTNAFAGCSALQTLVFSDLMTSFSMAMINNASTLKVLSTKNVTTIVGSIGTGNNSLERMEFPNVVTMSNILDNGRNTSVKLVDVGPSIQTINGTWLYHSGVTTIVVRATTPPTAQNAVRGLQTDYKIYVPYSADHSVLDAYKTASGWSDAASRTYELNPDGTIPTA